MGLHEARYVFSADKIYGVSENYIHKFNATTGAKEASQKVCAPCYGPLRIITQDPDIYVSSWADFHLNNGNDVNPGASNKTIWNVDKDTLAISNPLDMETKFLDEIYPGGFRPDYMHTIGIHGMVIDGGYLYFQNTYNTNSNVGRIKLDGTEAVFTGASHPNLLPQQIDTDADGKVLECDPSQNEIERWPGTFPFPDGNADDPTDRPIAVCWQADFVKGYAVCGNGNLWRVDDWISEPDITKFNLELVYANVKPMRIRSNPFNALLYIPCQNEDVVIIWDPSTDDVADATYVDGLNSPIDCVFTDAGKIFAVQSSPVGLVDITP